MKILLIKVSFMGGRGNTQTKGGVVIWKCSCLSHTLKKKFEKNIIIFMWLLLGINNANNHPVRKFNSSQFDDELAPKPKNVEKQVEDSYYSFADDGII